MKTSSLISLCVLIASLLVGCGGGGGGGGGSGSSSSSGGSTVIVPDDCSAITASSSSGSNSAFKQCKYDVYARLNDARTTVSGAGAVSNKAALGQDLNLGIATYFGSKSTTMTASDTAVSSATASGFPAIFMRAKGGVVAMCNTYTVITSNDTTAMDYVAVATGNIATSYQSVKVTSASGLSGVAIYGVDQCSFVDTTGAPQTGITGTTESLTFAADGSATSGHWGGLSAAAINTMLNGGLIQIGPYWYYGTLYQTIESSGAKYYLVLRDLNNKDLLMYVSG